MKDGGGKKKTTLDCSSLPPSLPWSVDWIAI